MLALEHKSIEMGKKRISIKKIRDKVKNTVLGSKIADRQNPLLNFSAESDESDAHDDVDSEGEDDYLPGRKIAGTRYDPNTVLLTGRPMAESYEQYFDALCRDRDLDSLYTTKERSQTLVFQLYNVDTDFNVDHSEIERWERKSAHVHAEAMKVMRDDCIAYIFGPEQKEITDLWKMRYCALDRFIKLPTRADQERVLFVIVADSVLRSALANDTDLYHAHVTCSEAIHRNCWNNIPTEDLTSLLDPHESVLAVFLWVATDQRIFRLNSTETVHSPLIKPPTDLNYHKLLKLWEKGDLVVNLERLSHANIPLEGLVKNKKRYLNGFTLMHQGMQSRQNEGQSMSILLKPWWDHHQYRHIMWHVESYILRLQYKACPTLIERSQRETLTPAAIENMKSNPYIKDLFPTQEVRPDLWQYINPPSPPPSHSDQHDSEKEDHFSE